MRNQILHIFRKDVRHLWLDIVLSLAILTVYAWNAIASHMGQGYEGYFFRSQALSLLVPVSLALLMLRALQSECLVGSKES
jgi:hypothetical protein